MEQDMEKKVAPSPPKARPGGGPRRDLASLAARSGAGMEHVERRTVTDRRLLYDRRQLIRFEDDRRHGQERRQDTDPWAFP